MNGLRRLLVRWLIGPSKSNAAYSHHPWITRRIRLTIPTLALCLWQYINHISISQVYCVLNFTPKFYIDYVNTSNNWQCGGQINYMDCKNVYTKPYHCVGPQNLFSNFQDWVCFQWWSFPLISMLQFTNIFQWKVWLTERFTLEIRQ